MICSLNKDDYCERHKKIHKGTEKILCLEDSTRGERFRNTIDRTKNRKDCGCKKKKGK